MGESIVMGAEGAEESEHGEEDAAAEEVDAAGSAGELLEARVAGKGLVERGRDGGQGTGRADKHWLSIDERLGGIAGVEKPSAGGFEVQLSPGEAAHECGFAGVDGFGEGLDGLAGGLECVDLGLEHGGFAAEQVEIGGGGDKQCDTDGGEAGDEQRPAASVDAVEEAAEL